MSVCNILKASSQLSHIKELNVVLDANNVSSIFHSWSLAYTEGVWGVVNPCVLFMCVHSNQFDWFGLMNIVSL